VIGLKEITSKLAKQSVIWRPHPGSQTKFLVCPLWEVLYDGNRGPGKTDALLMKFARYCGIGYGAAWRGVIFARRYKNLEEVKVKGKRFLYSAFPGCRFLESKADYKFVWPTGEELLLRAAEKDDDYWDYHGHEYPYIGWEELTKWPTSYLYDALKACSRSGVEGIPRFYCSTTNPYGPGHGWVKEYWFDPNPNSSRKGALIKDAHGKRLRVTGDVRENVHLMSASPQYVKILEAIRNEALREAWLHGSWEILVGGFFDGYFDPHKHLIDPFMPSLAWRRWRALDWGFARPYSIGWYAMNNDGKIYRYRELYGYGGQANVGTREFAFQVAERVRQIEADEVKAGCRFANNPADSSIWNKVGVSGRMGTESSIALEFAGARVSWQPASRGKDSRQSGWDIMRRRMAMDEFVVTKDCKHWRRTVPALMPDDNNWEDVDTEQEDHAADETRYSLVSRHRPMAQKKKDNDTGRYGTMDYLLQLNKTPPGYGLK
jgi:hypothetical protein